MTYLFTFDGMAGTKKTQLIRAIAKKQKAYFLNEFPNKGIGVGILEMLRRESKQDTAFRSGNPDAEMLLFLSLKLIQHKEIRSKNIVLEDRGLPSIIGYYIIQTNSTNQVERFNQLYDNFENFLIKSDKTIILTGDINRAVERFNLRDNKRYSNSEIIVEKKLDKLLYDVSKTRSSWSVLDIDKLPETKIVEEIVGIIDRKTKTHRKL